jgi:hypothetical protein
MLNGAWVQVVNAQASGAQPKASGLYTLLSILTLFALFALLVGAVRPKTFAFLFMKKATRGRVCGVFGAALLGVSMVASAFQPKPVAPSCNGPGEARPERPGQSAKRDAGGEG